MNQFGFDVHGPLSHNDNPPFYCPSFLSG